MSVDEIGRGKDIVEEALREECARIGVEVELEWGHASSDFDKSLHTLAYTIDSKRRVEKFSIEELSDAGATKLWVSLGGRDLDRQRYELSLLGEHVMPHVAR